MRVAGSRPSGFIQGLPGIILAAASLGVMPLPLTADIASVSGNAFFSEADSGDIQYTVNPDGSVQVTGGDPFTGFWYVPAQGFCASHICNPGEDFPSLPDGSTINSVTFSFDPRVGAGFNVGNGAATVDGSAVLTDFTVFDLNSPGCDFGGSAGPSLGVEYTFSFAPCAAAGDRYVPAFSGTDTFTLTPNAQFEFGSYFVGYNAAANVDYTITVNYSPPVPEPGTYGLIVGMIIVGLVTIRLRTRPTSRSHPS